MSRLPGWTKAMGLACILGWGWACGLAQSPATAPTTQPSLETLKKHKVELDARLSALQTQLYQRRDAVSRQDDLAELARHIAETRSLRDQRVAGSTKVQAAQKAAADAHAAINQVMEAEIAADPAATAAREMMEKLDEQYDEIEAQHRLNSFLLAEISRRAGNKPDVRQLRAAAERAENSMPEVYRKDPKIAAAREAYDRARQVLLSKPEIDAAKKAYDDAITASPLVAEAIKTRDAVRAAHDALLQARIAEHPQTAGLKKKIEELDPKLKDLAESRRLARGKCDDIRQKISNTNARVADTRKTYYAADAALRQALFEDAPNESTALRELERIYSDRLEYRVLYDAVSADIRRQIAEVNRQVQELAGELRKRS